MKANSLNIRFILQSRFHLLKLFVVNLQQSLFCCYFLQQSKQFLYIFVLFYRHDFICWNCLLLICNNLSRFPKYSSTEIYDVKVKGWNSDCDYSSNVDFTGKDGISSWTRKVDRPCFKGRPPQKIVPEWNKDSLSEWIKRLFLVLPLQSLSECLSKCHVEACPSSPGDRRQILRHRETCSHWGRAILANEDEYSPNVLSRKVGVRYKSTHHSRICSLPALARKILSRKEDRSSK